MRHFRHLSRAEITDIVFSFEAGEKQADLARRFNVDHSTINYHVEKFRTAYPEQGDIYAVIKTDIRRTCVHPSSRCTFCGTMKDELQRSERELITRLTRELADAQTTLRMAGLLVE